jgi:hypothetical protein
LECRRVEIIPPEPEQRPYLRREASQNVTVYHFFMGRDIRVVLTFFSAKTWIQTGMETIFLECNSLCDLPYFFSNFIDPGILSRVLRQVSAP